MKYNFDQLIERRGTDCVKYDLAKMVFGREDVLPMWVADMDFQSPPEVLSAARECSERGVFGYTFRSREAKQAFMEWCIERHQWQVERNWILSSPGIVTALSLGVRLYSKPGERVMIMTPVYPPFFSVVRDNGRELVCSSLVEGEERYEINWTDFEAKIRDGVKLLILSNPHNPVGRQWSHGELLRIGRLCLENGVTILSDEIHCDLSLWGHRHTVMASLSEEIAAITVTMMAPSKTFNIAGMMNSLIIISSPELREIFKKEIETLHIDSGNIFGHVTLKAAYRHGAPWLDEMLRYLENNIHFVADYIRDNLPGVSLFLPECSFLLWLDFRGTGLSHEEVGRRLLERAQLGLNNGTEFGPEGEGFFRMNIGCPLSVVKEGMERISRIF